MEWLHWLHQILTLAAVAAVAAPNTSGAQRKDKVFFSTFIEKVAKPTYIPTHSNGLLKSRN